MVLSVSVPELGVTVRYHLAWQRMCFISLRGPKVAALVPPDACIGQAFHRPVLTYLAGC